MKDFFAMLYEWGGLNPFYSADFGDFLRGLSIDCEDYTGTPYYTYVGLYMIAINAFAYALQYHFIDSPRYNRAFHWWMFALVAAGINFFIAFGVPFNALKDGYCEQLENIDGLVDCITFGISNVLWSLIVYFLLTVHPLFRRFSNNCRHTTCWKP